MGQRRTLDQDHRTWLQQEFAAWRQGGIVTAEQIGQIWEQYESADDSAARQRAWFHYALWGCTAVLFAAAAFLLVSFNWQELPAAAKLIVIFGVLATTYGLAFWLRLQLGWHKLADIVFLLGGFFYGAAIWLVAQVFHIDAHYPDGFFWWAAGLLPLALLLDSVLLHVLLVSVLAAYVSSEVLGFGHLPALLFGRRWPLLANGAYWTPLMAAAGLVWSYRRQSFWGVAVWVPLLAYWALLQPVAWRWDETLPYFVGAVGAVLLIIAESHPRDHRLAIPFRLWGALLFGGALVPLSYYEFNRHFAHHETHWMSIGTALVISVWAGLALAIAELLRYRSLEQGERDTAATLDDIRRRQWVPLAMTALMAVLALLSILNTEPSDVLAAIPTVLVNVAIVGTSFWLMSMGLQGDRAAPFVGGVAYFLMWVVMRYIDLFGNLGGMLGAAALFFLCGVALAGVAWFWRERKKVLHA